MPRRSLEILNDKIALFRNDIDTYVSDEPAGNSEVALVPKTFLELINTIQSMPAIKVIMNFRTNWWDISQKRQEYKSTKQMRGVSITDLPIRQCLYFGTATDNLLLASYNDMITTEYWSVLQKNFLKFEHQAKQKKFCNRGTTRK